RAKRRQQNLRVLPESLAASCRFVTDPGRENSKAPQTFCAPHSPIYWSLRPILETITANLCGKKLRWETTWSMLLAHKALCHSGRAARSACHPRPCHRQRIGGGDTVGCHLGGSSDAPDSSALGWPCALLASRTL